MSDWTDEEFGRISGAGHKKHRMKRRVKASRKTLPTEGLPD
jgi:hypothetical protein